ncbi:hypothetical protein [Pseudosulfitobacter sp. SM2401]|uniref:hypothetical protein n=1 Tax=Pseudosulfitobacter sp. SM2401 TaxID=3350098 RepID=UPI002A2B7CFB|nr:hypothetical protein [Ascidiaceihabitans sp.]
MRIKTVLTAGFGLMMMGAAPAFAEAKIYPYHGENFCPAGYQPITISGVVCCGQPNQSISYQQAKMTPAPRKVIKRHVHRARAQVNCTVGTKGCTFD